MAFSSFDPVITGFEQPSTRTPAGQLAIFRGPGAGVGIGAGAGVIGGPYPTLAPPPPQQVALPAIPVALAGLGAAVPALAGIAGVAAAGYGLAQAFGLGEGEGIFGFDLFGGDTQMIPGTPIELGGPGLAEPGPGTGWNLLKEWHVNYDWGTLQYYLIQKIGSKGRHSNRWIALYNTRTKLWKAWRWVPPKLAVIGKNMPRHQMLVRLRHNLSRHTADAKGLLKITSPHSLAKPKRRGYGGRHRHK